jgi:zinc transport system permease protein
MTLFRDVRTDKMAEFLAALRNPDIAFLRYALFAGILGSVSFGIVGTYVVTRRISYIAGAIAHSALGGIGAGLYLQMKVGIVWFTPLIGALVSAVASGIIIGLVSLYARQREDTVIGAIWAIGMAVGLLFLTKTPGYVEPMSYLFGNILMISKTELLQIALLDSVIIATGVLFYNKFLAVCFDEEFARLRGIRVGFFYLLLICLTALTVVLMVTVVGIVLVIALLTLPSAVAGLFSKYLWKMMIFSSLICMLFVAVGTGLSYIYDFPTGTNIILVAGAVYLASVLVHRLLRSGKT